MSEPRVITLVPRVPTAKLKAYFRLVDTRKFPEAAKVVEMELRNREEKKAA